MAKAKQKIFTFSLVFLFIFLLFSANSVLASNLLNSQEGFGGNGGSQSVASVFNGGSAPQDIRITVAKIIRVLLGFLGIIFTVLILYAGYLWMTAAGNDSKVEESKKILSRSIIGIFIIFMAYSISGFVMCSAVESTSNISWSCIF